MSNALQLGRAIHLAVDAHGGVLDKGGMPYIMHPLRIMERVKGFSAKSLAALHDTVEDTPVTISEDRRGLKFRYNPTNYTGFYAFDPDVIEGLDAITKRKGEKLETYWGRVKANPLALYVKLADIGDNSSAERQECLAPAEREYLTAKYNRARAFLIADAGVVPVIDNWFFSHAVKFLEGVGYEGMHRYLYNLEEQGIIRIGFDAHIRRVQPA